MEPLENVTPPTPEEREFAVPDAILRLALSHLEYDELEPDAQEYFKHHFKIIDRLHDQELREKVDRFSKIMKPYEPLLSDEAKKQILKLVDFVNKKDKKNKFIRINNSFINYLDNKNLMEFNNIKREIEGYVLPNLLVNIMKNSKDWATEIPKIIDSTDWMEFRQFFEQFPKNERNDYSQFVEIGNQIKDTKKRNQYFVSLFDKIWSTDFTQGRYHTDFNEFPPIPNHIFEYLNILSIEDRQEQLKHIISYQINSLKMTKERTGFDNVVRSPIETQYNNKLEYILDLIKNSNLNDSDKYYLLYGIERQLPDAREKIKPLQDELLKKNPRFKSMAYQLSLTWSS